MTTAASPGRRTGLTLRVPKRTSTPGDTLIAWGLAILAGEAFRGATLREEPAAFVVDVPRASPEALAEQLAGYQPTDRVRLPDDRTIYWVDRDELREGYELIRAQGQQPGATGDAPSAAAHELAHRYPHFQALTNPGTQWAGYNSFVELAQRFWSAEGIATILDAYSAQSATLEDFDSMLDVAMQNLGLTRTSDRRKNPPGFLFPGGNKGPTMRLRNHRVVIGQTFARDWMMADRGDLSIIERYLAFVGYFSVATIDTFRGGRYVAVPAPKAVHLPRMLTTLERVSPRAYRSSPPATAADAALAFAGAALEMFAAFQADAGLTSRGPSLLSGVHLSVFWMPSGNTYAVDHVSFVPLPIWLDPLFAREGFDGGKEVIERHRQMLRPIGWAEGEEARAAAEAYRRSLSGDVLDWLHLVPIWTRAALAEDYVGLWGTQEIERIALAHQPDLREIIHDPAFETITRAIRQVTVVAHFRRKDRQSRQHRQRDGESGDLTADARPTSRLSPQYDLIGALREAADRNRDEFLRELCEFVADYNNQAMRREQRLIRREDLEQVISWVQADRRGLIPSLLLAFGVAPRRREVEQSAAAGDDAEVAAAMDGDDLTGEGGTV